MTEDCISRVPDIAAVGKDSVMRIMATGTSPAGRSGVGARVVARVDRGTERASSHSTGTPGKTTVAAGMC